MAVALTNLPQVRNERCVRFRFRYSACDRCARSCPPGALDLGAEGANIDPALCSGCGLCAAACPTAAFHLPRFPTAALLRPERDTLTVACAPCGEKADVHVPCIGAIDLALLASLARRGVAVTVRGSGHCTGCANAPAGAERVESLISALDELGQADAQGWRAPAFESGAAPAPHRADRRQLFRRWTNRAVAGVREEAHSATVPDSAIRPAAHFVPPRRKLADRLLDGPALSEASAVPELFGVATLYAGSGQCTGCDACTRVCPTGALKEAEADCWELLFRSSQCVGCGVCIEACGAGALRLEPRWEPQPETPTVLHRLLRYRCQGCGRFFVGLEEDACPVCQDDQDSFDAIFG